MNTALAVVGGNPAPVTAYRRSTDAADTCKAIVVATATVIQGRKYVCVEGWQAIAIAHDCTASARDVEKVEGGVRAIGEIRRMSDGVVIAEAEGFVGEDEPTWYGGNSRGKMLPKRSDYAIRAMAQTRAISRACRSAFAHVVVMMNAGLQTTPAEEVPSGGFDDAPMPSARAPSQARAPREDHAPREDMIYAPTDDLPGWPDGPHSSKSKLMADWRKLVHALNGASDTLTVEGLIDDAKPMLMQFRAAAKANYADMATNYSGGGDFKGVADTLADARASAKLAEMEAGPAVQDSEAIYLPEVQPRRQSNIEAG